MILLSWWFAFPGDSRVLAIPNMSWRAVVWSYFNFNSKSVPGCFWRLHAPRRLVVSGLPVSTLYLDLVDEPACLLLWLELEVEDEEWVFL